MTNPAQGWTQVGGGYPGAPGQQMQQMPGNSGIQMPAPMQQQLPPGLQQLPPMLQQGGGFNLPPQMQQPLQLDQSVSPLSMIPPRIAGMEMPQGQQQRPQGQPQFPQQQFQQPQQQFQQQQPQQLDPSARLNGPGIPLELQGRTVAEAVHLYNGLRNTHMWAMQQAGQQGQGQQQIPQQQPAGSPQIQQQQGGQQQNAFDWRNPQASIGAVVREQLQQTIMPMLQPIAAQNAMGQIQTARQQAAQAIGPQVFAQIEAEVMQDLNGADTASLMNPRMWLTAAHSVIGRRQIQMGQQTQQPMIPQNTMLPGMYPTQQVGRTMNPVPNANSFFTEQSNQGGQGPQGVQLSQIQRKAAQMMNIPLDVYAAMAAGIQTGGF